MENNEAQSSEMQNEQVSESVIEQKQYTLEEAIAELTKTKSALKNANKEAASHRHKAKELDELKQQIEQEKLSETEKLQKQVQQLLSQNEDLIREKQERKIADAIIKSATNNNIIDHEAAAKLIDWSEIDYDDGGMPTNIDDLISKLAKSKPYLVGKQITQQVQASNPSRSSVANTNVDAILQKVREGKMTEAEYNALPSNVRFELSSKMSSTFGRR